MRRLSMRNHQREVKIDSPALRRQMRWLLDIGFAWNAYEIGVHFVSSRRMAKLNERHLMHEGPTDILTFNYGGETRNGELFICPKVSAENAVRHRVSLGRELSRYLIHGLLHMAGHDDKQAPDRRRMKRAENRLLRRLPSNG
jgi:probable rRNA maturation factor